jgi:hypothetical protein
MYMFKLVHFTWNVYVVKEFMRGAERDVYLCENSAFHMEPDFRTNAYQLRRFLVK